MVWLSIDSPLCYKTTREANVQKCVMKGKSECMHGFCLSYVHVMHTIANKSVLISFSEFCWGAFNLIVNHARIAHTQQPISHINYYICCMSEV